MLINANYIDDLGNIKRITGKINHNITSDVQLSIFKENILKKINESLLVLRGISDFDQELKLTKKTLKTNLLSLKFNSGSYEHTILQEPAFGSPTECISRNLELMAQIECHKVQSYFENFRIKIIPLDIKNDSVYLPLTEIRSNGIKTTLYEFKFTFNSDWSATCNSCINGMLHLRNEFEKISNHLYMVPNNSIETEGHVITDLNVGNTDLLKEQIIILLSNALFEAKVQDFNIYELGLYDEE